MVTKTVVVFMLVLVTLVEVTLAGPKPWPVASPSFFNKSKKCNCGYMMGYGGGGQSGGYSGGGGGGGGGGMGGGGYGKMGGGGGYGRR